MSGAILVTGATGMFGSELVPRLLAETDADLHILIHRDGHRRAREDVLRAYGLADRATRDRVHLLQGDVTRADLGLPRDAVRDITRGVRGIVHAAAATRFDLDLTAARRVNAVGTANALALASTCGRLDRFALVSTVYVSGRRRGTIRESELDHRAGFVNSYEQAKYEAECLARDAMSRLPVSIYRLSTLFGSSVTGATARFGMPHLAVRLIYLGLAPMTAGDPACVVDLLPTDVAATTVARLFAQRFSPGRTYHVVAGDTKSFTLAEVITASWDALARAEPAWARRRRPQPVVCDEKTFAEALRAARETRNVVLLRAFDTVAQFCGQFSLPKRFDASELCATLPDHDKRVPHAREYYARVVAYCVRTAWGRDA